GGRHADDEFLERIALAGRHGLPNFVHYQPRLACFCAVHINRQNAQPQVIRPIGGKSLVLPASSLAEAKGPRVSSPPAAPGLLSPPVDGGETRWKRAVPRPCARCGTSPCQARNSRPEGCGRRRSWASRCCWDARARARSLRSKTSARIAAFRFPAENSTAARSNAVITAGASARTGAAPPF